MSVQNSTLDLLGTLKGCQRIEELWSAIDEHLLRCGVTHAIYAFVDPLDGMRSRILTQLPKSWQDYYADRCFERSDPYFEYCCHSFLPVRTGADFLPDYPYLNKNERELIREAGETGFRSGFAAPVRLKSRNRSAFGGWNFGTTLPRHQFETFLKEQGASFWLLAFFAHEHIERLSSVHNSGTEDFKLSGRERECLLWLARGLRTEAIAERLGIARITVDLHFRNARMKLRTATREQALAKAIVGGLIVP